MTLSRRWKIFLIVSPVAMVLDQLTKFWARDSLPTGPHGHGISEVVIQNFWEWRLSENPGSAFGLFGDTTGARIFLTIIGLLAICAILWMVHKAHNDQRRLSVALGLVAGGAVGNLIDRIVFGVVTDFVVWKYHDTEWPTFNIADVALVVGVGLLFLDIGKEPSDGKEGAEASDAKSAKSSKAGGNKKPKRDKKSIGSKKLAKKS